MARGLMDPIYEDKIEILAYEEDPEIVAFMPS